MKTIIFSISIFLWAATSYSANDSLKLNEIQNNLEQAFAKALSQPTNETAQQQFLSAFPNNFNQFNAIFNAPDLGRLYNSHMQYLEEFEKILQILPEKTGLLLFRIAVNGKWDADAVGYLQHITIGFLAKQPKIAIPILKSFKVIEIQTIINFLADVENHDAYAEYEKTIKNLTAEKEIELANQFKIARTKRIKENDH